MKVARELKAGARRRCKACGKRKLATDFYDLKYHPCKACTAAKSKA